MPIGHTRTDFFQSKLYCEGAIKFVFAGATRLHKIYVRQKRYLLGARVAPVFAALAATFVPSCSFAQSGDDCWGPTQLSASAPDADSRDSITLLSDKEMAILLAEAAKHGKHPAAGIETIYSARNSDDAIKVLIFAFNKKSCLVDRGAIPIDKWEKVFGATL